MTVPSSSTKVGSIPSGFSRMSSRCGLMPPTTVRTQLSRSMTPVSAAAIITLRTKGERGDQCSFIISKSSAGKGDSKSGGRKELRAMSTTG